MKKLIAAMSICALALLPGTSHAHGDAKPRHGGVARMASDLTFELVAQGDSVMLYVSDHGKPMAIAGMSGKLTILTGSQKSEAQLIPSGDKLEAKGVKLVSGAKAVATLDTPAKKAITVRFTVK